MAKIYYQSDCDIDNLKDKTVAVIGYGSYLIVNGTISSGNFVSFITALILLYTPIKSIGKNYNAMQVSFLAIERLVEILDMSG